MTWLVVEVAPTGQTWKMAAVSLWAVAVGHRSAVSPATSIEEREILLVRYPFGAFLFVIGNFGAIFSEI